MKIDELDTARMYIGVKQHFLDDYDFFKYRGRVPNYSYETLLKKGYHRSMIKLSKRYEAKEIMEYFVANMLVMQGEYLFDVDAEGRRIYNDWLRRKDSRSYIFKQDVERVCNELTKRQVDDFWKAADVVDGQHPLLFRMFVGSFMAPESMAILYKMRDFITPWREQIMEHTLAPVVTQQLFKLEPFIMIKDLEPYEEIFNTSCQAIILNNQLSQ